jgi:hypothetical protein
MCLFVSFTNNEEILTNARVSAKIYIIDDLMFFGLVVEEISFEPIYFCSRLPRQCNRNKTGFRPNSTAWCAWIATLRAPQQNWRL